MKLTFREKLDRLLHPNKLKGYDLKFGQNPNLNCLDVNEDGFRHLVVLASSKEEALLMRSYIIYEGLEE